MHKMLLESEATQSSYDESQRLRRTTRGGHQLQKRHNSYLRDGADGDWDYRYPTNREELYEWTGRREVIAAGLFFGVFVLYWMFSCLLNWLSDREEAARRAEQRTITNVSEIAQPNHREVKVVVVPTSNGGKSDDAKKASGR